MAERRGGRRKLNVTGCKHVYKGTNTKGGEFNIYEVEATTEAGVVIQDKLTAWVELPMGLREFDVTPYEKDGVFKSWTLSVPKEQGGNSAAAREALAARVEFLEQQMEFALNKISSLEGVLSAMQQPGGQVPTPVGSGRYAEDDDIPF